MVKGRLRWTCLAALAAGNSLLWVGIACFVGLCAGDDVNLGVETLVRRAQATAATSLEAVKDHGLALMGGESGASLPRVPDQEVASSVRPAPATADVSLGENPDATVLPVASSWPPNVNEDPALFELPSPAAASDLRSGAEPPVSEPQTAAQPATATPDPAARALVSSPLLLVDPEFHTAALLDSEMERSVPGRPVQIRYLEKALNREIANLWLNNPDLPYRDVQVDLRHNGVAVSGKVTVFGIEVDAYLEGTVIAKDCVPRLEVESSSLAGVVTPRFLHAWVMTMVQQAMAWYPAGYPLCLEQIVLEETRVTCYGYRR